MKKRIVCLVSSAVVFTLAMILEHTLSFAGLSTVTLIMYIVAFLFAGHDVLIRAFKGIIRGNVFDMHFLMCVATIGAFAIAQYMEAVGVMLFYQVGELFQSMAVARSRKNVAKLMDIRMDYANLVVTEAGDKVSPLHGKGEKFEIKRVDPEEVKVGDLIVVKPGEKIPLDGVVVDGVSSLNTSALTGEAVPREVEAGVAVISGCINLSGLLTVEVTKVFGESTVSKILELVENAGERKTKTENFIQRFARIWTPLVVGLAVLLATIPPLIILGGRQSVAPTGEVFRDWLYRALTFLVVSCPCALVLSVPLSYFAGLGGASRVGVLLKGGEALEAMSRVDTVVFDKTGTLTKGVFEVKEVHAEGSADATGKAGIDEAELLRLSAYAESNSTHPIAKSIVKAYGKPIDSAKIASVEEVAGQGIIAVVDGKKVAVGNLRLMKGDVVKVDVAGTAVHVAVDGMYAGYIVIADVVKEDARSAIAELKAVGVRKTVMLTGDARTVAEAVAQELKLDDVYSELLPQDKVAKFEELLSVKNPNKNVAFVGDGINDAPVLARADVGIAMGGLGSDAAIEASDVVIMTDEPSKITTALRASRRTVRIVRENIIFSLGVKIGVLALSAVGLANMWLAVFADVGVTILAVLNAFRGLSTSGFKK